VRTWDWRALDSCVTCPDSVAASGSAGGDALRETVLELDLLLDGLRDGFARQLATTRLLAATGVSVIAIGDISGTNGLMSST